MRAISIILLSLFTFSFAQKSLDNTNPCLDKMYLELKEMKVNDMSEREYQYFMQMTQNCSDYQTTSKMVIPDKGWQTMRKVVVGGGCLFFLWVIIYAG